MSLLQLSKDIIKLKDEKKPGVIAVSAIVLSVLVFLSRMLWAFAMWLVYTNILSPMFSLPDITFFRFWLIAMFVNWVGKMVFGRTYVANESK